MNPPYDDEGVYSEEVYEDEIIGLTTSEWVLWKLEK